MNKEICIVIGNSKMFSLCGHKIDEHRKLYTLGYKEDLWKKDLICTDCVNTLGQVDFDKPPKAIQEMQFTDKYSMSKEVLTKREHFAFEFAKIFLEDDLDILKRPRDENELIAIRENPCIDNALNAVHQADELIKALNEEKPE